MKGRLDQAPLLPMLGPFTGEQTFPEQSLCAFEPASLHAFVVVGDEDVFDPSRIADDEQTLAAHLQVDDVAVSAGQAGEEGERIAAWAVDERAEERRRR